MDLSHQSITGRHFELNRRGYDPDAVNAHLSEIASAVAEREGRIAELEATIESLQAKVQDANESEEALRLTLKAAAHAKEELLAGAREQAKTMEDEAGAKAEATVAEATARAEELTGAAEARAAAIDEAAKSRAGDVARAALAESEALVVRIEGLRESLETAENALAALQTQASPEIQTVREALDGALEKARETVADPAVLEQLAADHVAAAAAPEPQPAAEVEETPVPDTHEPDTPTEAAAGDEGRPEVAHEAATEEVADVPAQAVEEPAEPAAEHAEAEPVPVEQPAAEEQQEAPQADAPEQGPDEGPHLEVVEATEGEEHESTADISDKVDRLLEELREVT
ncbi:MAG: DivIVA domain-containing protein, partial [Acidimicrobiia bacterium]|nr:DivIVA domain-containing protein [Acidimicrobiia bacterium]